MIEKKYIWTIYQLFFNYIIRARYSSVVALKEYDALKKIK